MSRSTSSNSSSDQSPPRGSIQFRPSLLQVPSQPGQPVRLLIEGEVQWPSIHTGVISSPGHLHSAPIASPRVSSVSCPWCLPAQSPFLGHPPPCGSSCRMCTPQSSGTKSSAPPVPPPYSGPRRLYWLWPQ